MAARACTNWATALQHLLRMKPLCMHAPRTARRPPHPVARDACPVAELGLHAAPRGATPCTGEQRLLALEEEDSSVRWAMDAIVMRGRLYPRR
jgi:hypothetical protein